MRAFEQTITKKEFVKELEKHRKADDFIRGNYGADRLLELIHECK